MLRAVMMRAVSVAALLGATGACRSGGAPASAPAAAAPPAAALMPAKDAAMPEQVGSYRLTERAAVSGFPMDSLYRFRDSSRINLSVIRYAGTDQPRLAADSQTVAAEGAKFAAVQQLLVERGAIQSFEVAFAGTSMISLGGVRIPEHATAVAVRSRGRVGVELQYLYVVGGKFLKVRASLPEDGWQSSDVPRFAREVARQLLQSSRR
jgi:hypothetical protein